MYTVIYGLYVWKYSYANRPFPQLTLVIYGSLFPVVILLALGRLPDRWSRLLTTRSYLVCLGGLATGFWLLMSSIDPSTIQIGRGPALIEWNELFLSGHFPYEAGTKPSGFPFLFLLATPCYLLGEVGLMQLIGLALFAWILYNWYSSDSSDRFSVLLLLAAAPIFAFEVCVRSDLITNAIILLAALEVTRRYHAWPNRFTPIWIGLLLGVCASTRGIFVPAYMIALPLTLRQHNVKYALMLLGSAVTGFTLTLLPFAMQNWEYFWSYGPFSVQMVQIPAELLATALAIALVGGFTVKTFRSAYLLIGALLFSIVMIKMAMSLISHGIAETIEFDNYFDLAYIGFALPFVLLAKHNCANDRIRQE